MTNTVKNRAIKFTKKYRTRLNKIKLPPLRLFGTDWGALHLENAMSLKFEVMAPFIGGCTTSEANL